MTLHRTILLAFLIWLVWTIAWLILTYYVTGGAPATLGKVVFAIFGPVIGIIVAAASAVGYRDLREAEQKGSK